MKKDIDLQEATMRAMLNETKLVEDDNELEWSSYSFDELNTVDKDYLEDAGDLASISKNLNDAGDLLVISLQCESDGFLLYANILDIDGEISDHPIDAVNVDITTEDNLKKDMNEFLNRVYSKLKSGSVYSDYFVENKIEEDVTPDREYQGIKYFDNQDGWCPVCNAHLHYEPVEYGGQNENGDSVSYCSWTCDKCGTRGEAYFKQSFIGHSVYNDDWDLIDLPFGEPKTEGKKTEAKLEDIQMEIYEMIQTARKVDKQDKDTNIKETLNAIRLEYPEINREELKSYIERKADEIYAGDYDEKTESKKVETAQRLYVVQGNYGDGWEDVYSSEDRDDAKARLKEYEENEKEYAHRFITRRPDTSIRDVYRDLHNDITAKKAKWGESKKVEATDRNIDKDKVLNMKYVDLPDMCYGLLPSDNSVIVIKKGETGYYETDYGTPENPEAFVTMMNEKLGVTPEQRMVMELRSMSGNWVLPNEGDKKVEDVNKLNNMYEQGTTELERAFTTEVKYWLQALIDDNPNDEIGVKALNIIDDDKKINEIVDELVNGSDDIWEDIHLRIEQLAGIDYSNSVRGK